MCVDTLAAYTIVDFDEIFEKRLGEIFSEVPLFDGLFYTPEIRLPLPGGRRKRRQRWRAGND